MILGGEDLITEKEETTPGTDSEKGQTDDSKSPENTDNENTESGSVEPSHWICVHICGQVREPGVYLLMEGSRVWDGVEAAGGLTEEAQPDAVNLAFCLADGSKVTIPSVSEAEEGTFDWYVVGEGLSGEKRAQTEMDAVTESGQVDINQADVKTLMTIPGIGQARAEAIVDYRDRQGDFQKIEDIMNVAGIKEGLFAAIRDYIIVGG